MKKMENYKIILIDNTDDVETLIRSEKSIQKIERISDYDFLSDAIKKDDYDVAIINPELSSENADHIVKELLKRRIPSLVILNKYDAVEKTIDALSAGAFDYFNRPHLDFMTKSKKEEALKDILSKIKLASESKDRINIIDMKKEELDSTFDFTESSEKIIIIGSSTGGPQSLEQIIPIFPKEIPGPIIVVQHIPEAFTQKLAERFDSISNINVKEAEDGEELKAGVCYIAKGDHHLTLRRKDEKKVVISLNKKDKLLGVRPCINITMESAARIYGKKVIGVVLTGMGTDGTIGSKKIKEKGGTVIVESEATSIIYGMPKSVVNSGYYDAIVDLQKIPIAVLQMLEV